MIRYLKPVQKIDVGGQSKYYVEVAIDNIAELEKLNNVVHGSVAQLIDANGLTVYVFNEVAKSWVVA